MTNCLRERSTPVGSTSFNSIGPRPPKPVARGIVSRSRPGGVVAVKASTDLDAARGWVGAVDRLLYDAKTPADALPGGMGVRFDWTLLDGFRHPLPWALSGGLDKGNVAEAICRTGATLVDACSGIETAPGVKDTALIVRFLKAVASA